MNNDDKTNIDVTPLLSNDVLAEVDTETKVENEEKIWSVGVPGIMICTVRK